MLKSCKVIMVSCKNILKKIGIKATSFTNQLTSYENITSHPVILPETRIYYSYITIIRGLFKTPLYILDGVFCENNQHI